MQVFTQYVNDTTVSFDSGQENISLQEKVHKFVVGAAHGLKHYANSAHIYFNISLSVRYNFIKRQTCWPLLWLFLWPFWWSRNAFGITLPRQQCFTQDIARVCEICISSIILPISNARCWGFGCWLCQYCQCSHSVLGSFSSRKTRWTYDCGNVKEKLCSQ